MADLQATILGIILFIFGIANLFYPHKTQKYALKYYDRHPTHAKFNPFIGYMKTPKYLISIRLFGLFCLLGVSFLVYVFIITN